jgi:thiol peroxidase
MLRRVTFENEPLTLTGREPAIGSRAPDCTLVTSSMEEARLSRMGNRTKVVTFFPSLDTPVCDIQVREFNKLARQLGDVVSVIGISMDLPFAQKRFCDTFRLRNLLLCSDYRHASFGISYGVLIAELNLLARGVAVIDGRGILRLMRVVREVSNHLDYEKVREDVEKILNEPFADTLPAAEEGETHRLTEEEIVTNLSSLPHWTRDGAVISLEHRFKSFAEAKIFLDYLAAVAEQEKHHPAFLLDYDRMTVSLTTHSAGGLTEKDFSMARIAEQMLRES